MGYRPLIASPRLLSVLFSLCLLATTIEARSHTIIIISSSHKCYDQNNNRINCPANKKAWIIAAACIGGFIALCLGIYLLTYCAACAICTCLCCACCTKRRKTKKTDAEAYQQLAEPANIGNLPTYMPNSMPYQPESSGASFINPPIAAAEKPYDPPEKFQPAYDDHSYDGHSYYAPPQLGYEYKSTDHLNASKVSLPEQTPSYQPPAYPPPDASAHQTPPGF